MSDKIASEVSVQLCRLLDQAVQKIDHCLEQLSDEQIWWRPEPNMNSIGNLLLHVSGNLRQWCVCVLRDLPDTRDRDAEFTTIQMDRYELEKIFRTAVDDAKAAMFRLRQEQLLQPAIVQGFEINVIHCLVHTTTHFQGHVHQILQLTRLQKKSEYRFAWSANSSRDRVPM